MLHPGPNCTARSLIGRVGYRGEGGEGDTNGGGDHERKDQNGIIYPSGGVTVHRSISKFCRSTCQRNACRDLQKTHIYRARLFLFIEHEWLSLNGNRCRPSLGEYMPKLARPLSDVEIAGLDLEPVAKDRRVSEPFWPPLHGGPDLVLSAPEGCVSVPPRARASGRGLSLELEEVVLSAVDHGVPMRGPEFSLLHFLGSEWAKPVLPDIDDWFGPAADWLGKAECGARAQQRGKRTRR